MSDRIGIFGGTFDPIHNGHISLAKAALSDFSLDKLIIMPNGNPPHKPGEVSTSSADRYNMVCLAAEGIKSIEVSDYEIKRTTPSYTIDTYRVMKEKYGCEVFFIIGADSLYTLHTWKSYDILVKECKFIVADRNCEDGSDIVSACQIHNDKGGYVRLLKMPTVDITSTQIRQMVKNGSDINGLVPDKVAQYIIFNKLYQE